jgi:hypothetical protein
VKSQPNAIVDTICNFLASMGKMTEHRFSLILIADRLTDDQILDATDLLGNAGCTDASICGHEHGMELIFERAGASLQAAISTAVADVERAGFQVCKVSGGLT